jgi:glycosyltransferase involved in cell wall biosynthesis
LTPRVGIVVPTLGKRPDYLTQCLKSIQSATTGDSSVFVVIVAPQSFDPSSFLSQGLIQKVVEDPGTGLAGAINVGFAAMPNEVEYINWLGDDDLIHPNSIDLAAKILDNQPRTVLVFGSCDYVDPAGKVVWTNKSGPFAVPLLRFGPDLIPQPGALFRKKSFFEVGGLSLDYDWAFDFDLFIKFSKIGKLSFINKTLSSFRWHPESLSVEYRTMSVEEASKVRTSHLPVILRSISCVWEYPVRQATMIAGNRVTAREKRMNQVR